MSRTVYSLFLSNLIAKDLLFTHPSSFLHAVHSTPAKGSFVFPYVCTVGTGPGTVHSCPVAVGVYWEEEEVFGSDDWRQIRGFKVFDMLSYLRVTSVPSTQLHFPVPAGFDRPSQ